MGVSMNVGKRRLANFGALLVLVVSLFVVARPALAYEQHEVGSWKSGTYNMVVFNKTKNVSPEINEIVVYEPNPNAKNKISKVKLSNKNVAKIKYKGNWDFTVELKKAGTTTITYTYKGKTYKHKLVVNKYTNPMKSFKVGSTEYKTKFKKTPICNVKSKISGKKVKVKAASGWKISEILVSTTNGEKRVKNGYKLKKGESYVTVVLKNKKKGTTEAVSVWYDVAG